MAHRHDDGWTVPGTGSHGDRTVDPVPFMSPSSRGMVFRMTASRVTAPQIEPGTKPKGPASYFPSIEAKYDRPVQHWIDPAWGRCEATTETTCTVHVGADSLAAIARWLVLLDADLTVIEPPALAAEFDAIAARASRAARTPAP